MMLLGNSSFDPYSMKAAAIEIASLSDEEYREHLERSGYSDRHIEKELTALREYRESLSPLPEPEAEKVPDQPTEDDPWSSASFKKRKERKVRFYKPILGAQDDPDEEEDFDYDDE